MIDSHCQFKSVSFLGSVTSKTTKSFFFCPSSCGQSWDFYEALQLLELQLIITVITDQSVGYFFKWFSL